MRSDEPSPFTPPVASRIPAVLIALALGAAAFAGWRYGGFGAARKSEPNAPSLAAEPTAREAANRSAGSTEPRLAPPEPRTASQPPLAWVRCEANGREAYSDSGCAGVGTQKSSSADTRAALSTLPTGAAGQGTTTIYRCKSFSGTVYWSAARCDPNKALIERMASVPRDLSFQQQVGVAERASTRVQGVGAAPVAPTPSRAAATDASHRQRECRFLDAQIRQLDAWARQPLSAQEQDRVREQRKAARDRQFALHC